MIDKHYLVYTFCIHRIGTENHPASTRNYYFLLSFGNSIENQPSSNECPLTSCYFMAVGQCCHSHSSIFPCHRPPACLVVGLGLMLMLFLWCRRSAARQGSWCVTNYQAIASLATGSFVTWI